MDYLTYVKDVFKQHNLLISERLKIVEIQFDIASNEAPSFEEIEKLLTAFPTRDNVQLTLVSDADDYFKFSNNNHNNQDKYIQFCSNAELGYEISVKIEINKNISNEMISVYNLKNFSNDILNLSFVQVLNYFSLLFNEANQLTFEVFDEECFFKTRTLAFISTNNNFIFEPFNRKNRLQDCKDSVQFCDINAYELLPDDFKIEIDYDGNPLSELFAKISTVLSLANISTSTSMIEESIAFQISGQRNVEFSYSFSKIKPNHDLYKIYNWIFTDGNSIDKAILARNILSLHCRFSDILELDGKTLASIQSNYALYLKNNVSQYIALKNSLAEFINESVSKTADYATELLDKFKSNLIAIFGFLFTVVLANIVSNQPLDSIFTRDIAAILKAVLIGSFIYLLICLLETIYKKYKVKKNYNMLKENYSTVLTEEDIQDAFRDDKLIEDMNKSINCGIVIFTIIWLAIIVLAFIAVENLSSDSSIVHSSKETAMQIINYFETVV